MPLSDLALAFARAQAAAGRPCTAWHLACHLDIAQAEAARLLDGLVRAGRLERRRLPGIRPAYAAA